MCKGDINRHQPKTAKINLGLNHHVLNSRTVRLLFTWANILNRRLGMCSVPVKITLFRSFCIYMVWHCGRDI